MKKIIFKFSLYFLFFFLHGLLCTDEKEGKSEENEIGEILLALKDCMLADETEHRATQTANESSEKGIEKQQQKRKFDDDVIPTNANGMEEQQQKLANKLAKNEPSSSSISANISGASNKIHFVPNFFDEPSVCKVTDKLIMKSFNRLKATSDEETANLNPNSNNNNKNNTQRRVETKNLLKIYQKNTNENSTPIKGKSDKTTQSSSSISHQKSDDGQQQSAHKPKFLIDQTRVGQMVRNFLAQRTLRWKLIGELIGTSSAPLKSVLHCFKGKEKRRMEEQISVNKAMLIFAGRCMDAAVICIELSLLPFTVPLSKDFNCIYYTDQNERVTKQITRDVVCALVEPVSMRGYLNFYIELLINTLPDGIMVAIPNDSGSVNAKDLMKSLAAYLDAATKHISESTPVGLAQKLSNLKLFYHFYRVTSNLLDQIRTDFSEANGLANELSKTKEFVFNVRDELRRFVRRASQIGFEQAKSEKCGTV